MGFHNLNEIVTKKQEGKLELIPYNPANNRKRTVNENSAKQEGKLELILYRLVNDQKRTVQKRTVYCSPSVVEKIRDHLEDVVDSLRESHYRDWIPSEDEIVRYVLKLKQIPNLEERESRLIRYVSKFEQFSNGCDEDDHLELRRIRKLAKQNNLPIPILVCSGYHWSETNTSRAPVIFRDILLGFHPPTTSRINHYQMSIDFLYFYKGACFSVDTNSAIHPRNLFTYRG